MPGCLSQSAGDIAFPHAGRSEDEQVLVILYPLRILRQSANDSLLQTPRCSVIDVLDTSAVTEFRTLQASRQRLVLALIH